MAQDYIDALLRERAGYERRGLADRVTQVDEQLRIAGYAPPVVEEKPAPVVRGKRTTKA